MRYIITRPTRMEGHAVAVLETRELLEDWAKGVDFSGLSGERIAVEDRVVISQDDFWQAIDEIVNKEAVEIRTIPIMQGG